MYGPGVQGLGQGRSDRRPSFPDTVERNGQRGFAGSLGDPWSGGRTSFLVAVLEREEKGGGHTTTKMPKGGIWGEERREKSSDTCGYQGGLTVAVVTASLIILRLIFM